MTFNVDPEHPLLRLMPDVMRMSEFAADEPGLPHLLAAMAREVALERVGAGGILARLADVLAASIIRAWVERGCGEAKGWVAAARCPQIGKVLAAIHGHPERDWNVESLATLIGVSRSGFAERFAEVVGETPARYVAQVRMHLARHWLIRDKLRIALVAQRLGYTSEASFSRAFKRIIGTSPSEARAEEPPRVGMFMGRRRTLGMPASHRKPLRCDSPSPRRRLPQSRHLQRSPSVSLRRAPATAPRRETKPLSR